MSYVKGIVSKVHVGEPIEPKNPTWAKSAKFGLEIDGKWYNGFITEYNGTYVVKDKNYKEVTVGCEVEFMTTDKNGHENVDRKTMSVLSTAAVETKPQDKPYVPNNAQITPEQLHNEIMGNRAILLALLKISQGEVDPKIITDEVLARKTKELL